MTREMDDEAVPLGVMAPDSARTILVIDGDGDLAVGLRDRVDRAYAVVRDVRPDESGAGFAASLPWPWMVVGGGADVPPEVLELVRSRPILVYWRGRPPEGLPHHTRSFDRFAELVAAVRDALNNHVAGMRLAVGLGVDLPDGSYARSAELQALVAGHPQPFDVPLDAFRSAARVLAAHRVPVRPARAEDGTVSLVETAGGGP